MKFPFALKRRPKRRRVVYTCLFGYSELLNDFPYKCDNVDFICFTDDPDLKSQFWTIIHLPSGLLDSARASKRIKHLPHLFLQDYEESLYIDNRVKIETDDVNAIFQMLDEAASFPFRCFRHPWRNCVYDEAVAIIENEIDDVARVQFQMNYYKSLGYPEKNGLAKGAVLLRRHHHPDVRKLAETWFQQILRHSMRDQLSLNVVAWHHRFSIRYLDGCVTDGGLFRWPVDNGPRLPRDFEEISYLQMNPDLIGKNIHPRRHYLLHGMKEGRPYKARIDGSD